MNLKQLAKVYLQQLSSNEKSDQVENDSDQMEDKFSIPSELINLIAEDRSDLDQQLISADESSIGNDNRFIKQLFLFWLLSTTILIIIWYGINLIKDESEYRNQLQSTSNGWRATLTHVIKKIVKKDGTKRGENIGIIEDDQSDVEEELLFDRRKLKKLVSQKNDSF